MDTVRDLADLSIRKACGFAGLGIAVVMLALSYSLELALRSGAALSAVLCLGLLLAAWRAPRRDVRDTELWCLLPDTSAAFAQQLPRAEAQVLLTGVLRARLLWHAERVAALCIGLYLLGLLAALLA